MIYRMSILRNYNYPFEVIEKKNSRSKKLCLSFDKKKDILFILSISKITQQWKLRQLLSYSKESYLLFSGGSI